MPALNVPYLSNEDRTTAFPRAEGSTTMGVIHRPSPTLWLLELRNGTDNRLTGEMLQMVIMPALNLVEKEWRSQWRGSNSDASVGKASRAGSLIISGPLDQDKFFSNGFDYEEVITTPGQGFIFNNFVPILNKLMTFPIPTVCALNGHTFAAGFMLALACDYRVMTSGRAWACMNEVHFGAPFPHSFAALLQEKARTPSLIRAIAMEGRRFTPKEMLASGLVDALAEGGTKGTVKKATELAASSSENASTGVWGLIKKELYGETLAKLAQDTRAVMPLEEDAIMKARL
ncbi:hypothetical protein FRB94_004297 [Tulasnella sp. JGI-2019a]|nr:hypothetical protein FRB93_000298 [Tulasnella sp. JGI-2019a]KAG9015178.1 hypothetical protein FRB94_004297 [Tulasnella sp. JGI-2019a]KAG9039247.1 hypothetical protein FRB95_011832 [Tulasnella sp. JGI-2019a]